MPLTEKDRRMVEASNETLVELYQIINRLLANCQRLQEQHRQYTARMKGDPDEYQPPTPTA